MWRLGGTCEGCALCCDHPTMSVGRLIWFMPTCRRLFLWWQRVVNGFVFERAERSSRSLVFRCTHLDPITRKCDSYDSRPGMCRDYPRLLLGQAWPEFFDGCGFRAVATDPERTARILEQTDLSPEQRKTLEVRLRLR